MATKTFWLSFGDLKVGETFVFNNPYVTSPLSTDYLYKKISARKYRVVAGADLGTEWQTSVKSTVVRW
jgi:hypothetical protein